jgi:hypothetical protein
MGALRWRRGIPAAGMVAVSLAIAALLAAPTPTLAAAARHDEVRVPAAHGASKRPVRAIAACAKAAYKPTSYVMTCADAGIELNKAHYQWWTRHTAHGNGVYSFNDCTPSCAAGTFHSQAASFTLYRVVKTSKYGRLFSRIEIDTRQGHHEFSLPTSTI